MDKPGYTMDKPREGDPRRLYRHLAWGGVAATVIAVFIVADRLWLRPGAGIERDEIMAAVVERGTLPIEVQGAGELEPVNERLIASEIAGAVDQIFARAGEQVAVGEKIVGLMNPQVRQGVVAARLQLAEANADHRRRLADFTDRRLVGEAQILNKQAAYEESQLRLAAETELRERQAISEIDYRSTKIRTERAKTDLTFEQRRFEELQAVLKAEQASSEARLAERESALKEAERLAEGLVITADIAGTLREVLVEPGERVGTGTTVARIVDAESLRGVIRVPESYASRVVPGQSAVATVLRTEVPGLVTRVDPAVTQNTVAVDIEFQGELPSGARPDLSIRATITVAELADTLFVRRPLRVNDDSNASVFRLADDRRSARRTSVRFGMGTLKHIEVLDGLDEGDEIILGDLGRFENEETIAIR
ncbi:MAG: HlyD family efflux transporter periplasmic adaptor subunit [Gammaproteobacteria bacterium]|nr:HlyD family efflux transporter periplasmic adaptor subunit [Gammaproteobacteria bacterium]MDE0444250.1 HlyD family efflux transporter periplasmic adaptor subunit [Gammaproteobacteria bacterium]